MKVYITCWQDHHDDPITNAYRNLKVAISDTKRWVKERCRKSNYKPVENDCDSCEWDEYVYHVEITTYGDHAYIQERDLL